MHTIEIIGLQFKDSSDKEVLYEILNKKSNIVLYGEYGKFKSCLLGSDKAYIDQFSLRFESKDCAEVYINKVIEFYNTFSEPSEERLIRENFEIREVDSVGAGQVVTFNYKDSEKNYKIQKIK